MTISYINHAYVSTTRKIGQKPLARGFKPRTPLTPQEWARRNAAAAAKRNEA